MKRIKIFGIALVAMTATFASCGNDFLTVYPQDRTMASEFYRTEADMTAALVAAYAPLHWEEYSWGWGASTLVSEFMADDMHVGGESATDRPELQTIARYQVISRTGGYNRWFGLISYSGVNRACHVIEHLPNVEMDDAKRDRMMSEALFLRTYYYYNLWRFFGNVPYYEVNLTLPYTTRQYAADEVYEACVATLNTILEMDALPENLAVSDLGRVNKAAVQMLKARFVMLQMDQTRFGEVLEDMRDIISSGHFALKTTTNMGTSPSGNVITPFEALYMDEGEFCSETIFDHNKHDDGSTTGWNDPIGVGGSVVPQWIGVRNLTGNSEFDAAGWGACTIPEETYNAFADGDTRRDASILNVDKWLDEYAAHTGEPRPTWVGKGAWEQVTGYYLRKYQPRPGYNNKGKGTGETNMAYRNNIRIFRYAETLLNAAELILRTGGPASEAQGYFDQIRDRAYDVENGGTAPAMTVSLDNIMNERRFEFVGDGLRYWDLVRTGRAAQVLGPDGWVKNATMNGVDRMLWPIPQDEMDADHNLRQPEDFVPTAPEATE